MTLNGLKVEQSPLVLPGYWVYFSNKRMLGMIGQDVRDFYAKFGLTVEPPSGATTILMDKTEYDRMQVGSKHKSV